MKSWLTILLFSFVATVSSAQVKELWQRANSFYTQKQYDSAVSCYQQLEKQGIDDARLYYNLGNAAYRMNNISTAVFNYRKALWRDAGFNAARENLLLAESRIPNSIAAHEDIFFVRWWQRWTMPYLSNIYAWMAGCLFLLAAVLFFWKGKTWQPLIRRSVVVSAVLVVTVLLIFSQAANYRSLHPEQAVVMTKDAQLQELGKEGSRILLMVPEGTTITMLAKVPGFVRVRLPDGRTGYMEPGALAVVN